MPVYNFLIKPTSHLCNLACEYCFYRRVSGVYPQPSTRMTIETAELLIKQALDQGPGRYSFCWQGGEPTLMGLDFFRDVIRIQTDLTGPGQSVENSIQTNGLLIDSDWAGFLHDNRVLVGLSLDGPQDIHDQYRVHANGKGSYGQVMQTAGLLAKHNVDFNILTLLTNANVDRAEELYRFFRGKGFSHLQFIPCLERDERRRLKPYSVTGEQVGRFYTELFSLWLSDGFPRVSIRLFEDLLIYLLDSVHVSCGWGRVCDTYLLVEHNGDMYPCDFYVSPEWRLGNLRQEGLAGVIDSPKRKYFAVMKSDLPGACRSCKWLQVCQGDCTRHRAFESDEKSNVSEYCTAWKMLFEHVENHPRDVRAEAMQARQEYQARIWKNTGRNDPCPCGSGRKFKKCCLPKMG
jgi:uncharacterized protein